MKYKLLCDHDVCYLCGCKSVKNKTEKKFRNLIEIHHIIERNEGGTNSPHNLVPLCSSCHSVVHSGIITLIGWFDCIYCFKLKWTDKDGNKRFGPGY
jgi:predicted HNH restriction endonuclease